MQVQQPPNASHSKLALEQEEENFPAAITDIGCERDINEDRYAAIDAPIGSAWIVCDGMGGALGGELAAQLAIDSIRRELESKNGGTPQEILSTSIQEANRIIVLRRQNPAFSGMGTTVVSTLISGREVVIAHAGDSRAYIVRGESIRQLTVDHTYVQALVEKGAISEEEALYHPQAHVLTRCLGADLALKLDVDRYWLWDSPQGQGDDKLVLCSDGLYSLVTDPEIAKIVRERSPQESCAELVRLAKERGGFDNITVSVLPLEGQLKDEAPPPSRIPLPSQVRRQEASEMTPSVEIPIAKKLVISVLLVFLSFIATTFLMMINLIY